jgi:hypothetical protein
VNRWLRWYETLGVTGLLTETPPGPAPRLSEIQRTELTTLIAFVAEDMGLFEGKSSPCPVVTGPAEAEQRWITR